MAIKMTNGFWILLTFLWVSTTGAVTLENEPLQKDISDLERQVNAIENQLKDQEPAEQALLHAVKTLSDINNKINSKIDILEADGKKIINQITSLGEVIVGESLEVKEKRQSLQNEKLDNEKWLSQFRVLSLRSSELFTGAKARLNELLAIRLLHKAPSIIELIDYVVDNIPQMLNFYTSYLVQHHGLTELSISKYIFLFFITSAALIIGIWLRAKILVWSSTKQWGNKFSSNFFETFSISTARYLPSLFLTATLGFLLYSFLSGIEPVPMVALIAYALPFFLFSIYLAQLFLSPKQPARLFLPIPVKTGRRISYKFNILAVLSLISFILIMILYLQKAPQQFLHFFRVGFVFLAVINLIWIVVYSKNIPQLSQKTLARMLIIIALLVLLILEFLGYRNLVFTVSRISFIALIALVVAIMLHRMSKEFYDGLDSGALLWHKKIRSTLGLKAKQPVPGMTFIRLVTILLLWGGFVIFVISLLDFSGQIRQTITTLLIQGISLGDLNINPTRILFAIVVFALLYTLSSWIKVQLDRQWLSKTRIERGAKEALVTVSGYIGVALALIIALGIAGVTFTNFAIIAGALSVGIGFGLQNIVNNFVSGLILLFERPIKNGDWIIVGNTEGYVKKISIRSTQIQTFDRSDIIVPNSELVSTQVTNWMLHDRTGRIRVPVGVAYGSDTEKVRQLLFDVAMAHPQVIKDSPDYKIKVFFLRFGDSSLDFELRCFIEDIDNALTVKSDLHFAIDKIFKENGVEIPFPQRDIHVRSKDSSTRTNENTKI